MHRCEASAALSAGSPHMDEVWPATSMARRSIWEKKASALSPSSHCFIRSRHALDETQGLPGEMGSKGPLRAAMFTARSGSSTASQHRDRSHQLRTQDFDKVMNCRAFDRALMVSHASCGSISRAG